MPTTTIFDTEDEFIWDSVAKTVDENGILTDKLIRYDNDTVTAGTYTNGQRTSVIQIDESSDGSAKSWKDITTNFTIDGVITDKVIQYDNDTVRIDGYTSGQRTSMTFRDESNEGSARNWQEITTNYDVNGLISDKVFVYDNDTIRFDSYSEGSRTSMLQVDESHLGAGKSWEEIYTTYNSDGTVQDRTTIYDDGRVRRVDFEDISDTYGNPIDGKTISIADTGDIFNWDAAITTYDADNNLVNKIIVYDNEDALLFQYENGSLSILLDVDGDDSHSWFARERFYDENNNLIETIHYDTADDVPEYYGLDIGDAITTAL
jgi:hypothetical protein